MKFLLDVHISYKLGKALRNFGYEAVHVNTILDRWFTDDITIACFADKENYTLISKDSDFRNSYLIKKSPKKLIKVNLGNISNDDLIQIFHDNLEDIVKLNSLSQFMVEIDVDMIRVL
jgi:predicted nuclease of predicted toxin-antitoxin system